MILAYIAKRTITFTDGTSHLVGNTYFATPETSAYFEIMSSSYDSFEVKELDFGGRTFAAPNHEMGYTKSYILGYMEHKPYSSELFRKWMCGQTVGVSNNNETVYYYNDVVKYLTQGGALAEVVD